LAFFSRQTASEQVNPRLPSTLRYEYQGPPSSPRAENPPMCIAASQMTAQFGWETLPAKV
jgi:hypothetical protein